MLNLQQDSNCDLTFHVLVELLYASDLHELKINMSHLDIASMTPSPGQQTPRAPGFPGKLINSLADLLTSVSTRWRGHTLGSYILTRWVGQDKA